MANTPAYSELIIVVEGFIAQAPNASFMPDIVHNVSGQAFSNEVINNDQSPML